MMIIRIGATRQALIVSAAPGRCVRRGRRPPVRDTRVEQFPGTAGATRNGGVGRLGNGDGASGAGPVVPFPA